MKTTLRNLLALAGTVAFAISNAQAAGSVVICEIYGGGGNSGATYRNDFVVLFNRGDTSQNMTGWSMQYASSAGTTWQKLDLPNASIPCGGYFLIQLAQGAGGTVTLPTPDAIGTITMSATSGKVALVSSTTALSGSCPPPGGTLVDLVGYGSANCFEGSGGTAPLNNTTSAQRKNGGCTDTENNSADFLIGSPLPRNSISPLSSCLTPSSVPLQIERVGDNVVLTWSDPAFSLASATSLDAPITNKVPGATSPHTNTLSGATRYFQLIWP
jgi:hypothetical protein